MVENYMKDLKESVYHGAVITAVVVVTQCLEKF